QTLVLRAGGVCRVKLHLGEGLPLHWEILGQDKIAEGTGKSPWLELPENLPQGIFTLRLTVLGAQPRFQEGCLIVCPRRAFQGEQSMPRRMWALAVQLYAIPSRGHRGARGFFGLPAP